MTLALALMVGRAQITWQASRAVALGVTPEPRVKQVSDRQLDRQKDNSTDR